MQLEHYGGPAIGTTWPVHDAPWDFFRFSKHAWQTLFNPQTGFEIVAAEHGEPASVRSRVPHPPTIGLSHQPAFLNSCCIVRKISETTLRWDVSVDEVLQGSEYPKGER
ncbi:hypothetical protein [Nocardioides sp. cx-173]|uniref:hypothetical protein n=1 Tax=Nocardioides sp. cx-173 TaxID=2898796 RepID=UPI001E49D394|nr:hypothetical protein [Nocardioides sp. cx-173]MCD4527009.1 hypothetical protein [Nocardioides sp. cx-173]UGB41056.1 hypothetical protein LQ940_17000 [Nocardioides sp. cx-173]